MDLNIIFRINKLLYILYQSLQQYQKLKSARSVELCDILYRQSGVDKPGCDRDFPCNSISTHKQDGGIAQYAQPNDQLDSTYVVIR